MKRLSAHMQPTNLYMCFSMSCPADVEGKCFSFVTNAVSLEGKRTSQTEQQCFEPKPLMYACA